MKNVILILVGIILGGTLASGQQKHTGIVKLRGTRLTYPLVNKWIAEFNKEHPDIKVTISPAAPADSIDFSIASYALAANDLDGGRNAVIVSRYVQLPVANSKRADLAELQTKGLTEKGLEDLFFAENSPTFVASFNTATPIALYVRDRPVCAVRAFSKHFGNDPKQINGVGIKGDDQDLAEAVRNDVNGISFNNLGFIYDVNTRRVSDGLAVIPLDLNENGIIDKEEKIYGTLDSVLEFIKRTQNPKFVNEPVNFVFNKNSANASAGIFLDWVLTKGQNFQDDLGFLNVDEKLLSGQRAIAANSFKISSSSCEGADELMKKRKSKSSIAH